MAFSKAEEFPEEDIRVAVIAKALSHPARVAIIRMLARKKTCICNDMVEELPLSQSTISNHLRELRDAGLIMGETDGPRVCYCLDLKACARATKILDQFCNAFQKCC